MEIGSAIDNPGIITVPAGEREASFGTQWNHGSYTAFPTLQLYAYDFLEGDSIRSLYCHALIMPHSDQESRGTEFKLRHYPESW